MLGAPMAATIRLFNSLTRRKEEFVPLEPGRVRMYVCGPTVYSDCHIGHTMGPVLFDAIARWLAARGYDVRFVNNITDIEDKIIARAEETGEDWKAITDRYTRQYDELLAALNVGTITDQPRCTGFIDEMVAFIAELVDAERAYVADDGVYFDVARQRGYGKLSGRDLADMVGDAGEGVRLRHPADFAMWKLAKPDEPSWPSPWGDGRPGWHIECSVMSSQLLGGTFDIHGGGEELKFPHHENEIAQSEAHGDDFARYWMHNGLVQYEGRKVSKSDPRMRDEAFARQFQARHLVATFGGEALRYHILGGHYRRPQEFKSEQIAAARTALERLRRQLREGLGPDAAPLPFAEAVELPVGDAAAAGRDAFCAAMDDDFNTGAAIAALHRLAAAAREADADTARSILRQVHAFAAVLGLLHRGLAVPGGSADGAASERLAGVVELLLELRQKARADRDFATADRIRDRLAELGIVVKDAKDGASWELAEG